LRLPLEHPDYRYPESKNPYWSKLKSLEGSGLVYCDNETEAHRGQWLSQMPDGPPAPDVPRRKLSVEVGCNTGHVIRAWAERDPKGAYIGVEWKFKIVHRGAEMARKKNLKNILFFRAHAERLHHMFAPGEIDHLHIYFPDPWPKKSQWKNRYLTAQRLRLFAPLIAPDGFLHIKTDHTGYFEWILKALEETKDIWEVLELSRDLHEKHPAPETLAIPEVTLFERLFIKDKIKINSLRLRPRF
jgi:tRNA (guanine-N7-)-methyltransferase